MHPHVIWLRQLVARKAVFRRLPRLLRKGRVPIILVWAALIFGLTQTERFRSYIPLQKVDASRVDWRFRMRGNQPPNPNVVIVGVTGSSLDATLLAEFAGDHEAIQLMQNGWPWKRRFWALLIDRLMELGAKIVALDILFPGEREGNADIAAMLAKYPGRIVLGSTMNIENNEGIRRGLTFIVPDPGIVGPDPHGVVGYCFLAPDLDNVIRRVSYRTSELHEFGVEDDTRDLTAFSALAVEKFSGQRAPGGYDQPINYQGPPTTYPYIPVEEVFIDRLVKSDPKFAGGAAFKDKLVFVGPIAETFHDVHKTPFGRNAETTPGVEIHAQVAGALLSGQQLRDAPPQTTRWLAFGVSVLAVLALIRLRTAAGQLGALVVVMAAVTIGTQWFFAERQLLIPVGAADFCLVAIGLFGVTLTFTTAQLDRALIRGVLDRYVSKNVANLAVERADDFQQMLRGEKRNVTVLFSDVRGFTSIFETSDATGLVAQLNEYFARMVALIHGQGGTLQKFIGDAIMAAWGDTHSLGAEEDALRAVRTALTMRPALAELNRGWSSDPARFEMRIGIGVNHGEAVVGEIGSPERMEFTLLGDAVNTAARFESATKQYGVDILIGGSVEQLTQGRFVYRRVDLARFKGKKLPVETFAVLSDHTVPAPAWLAEYHDGMVHFRAQRWAEAETLFRAVNAQLGGNDFLCQMYLARLAEFAAHPPPANWDGAHTLTEK